MSIRVEHPKKDNVTLWVGRIEYYFVESFPSIFGGFVISLFFAADIHLLHLYSYQLVQWTMVTTHSTEAQLNGLEKAVQLNANFNKIDVKFVEIIQETRSVFLSPTQPHDIPLTRRKLLRTAHDVPHSTIICGLV